MTKDEVIKRFKFDLQMGRLETLGNYRSIYGFIIDVEEDFSYFHCF